MYSNIYSKRLQKKSDVSLKAIMVDIWMQYCSVSNVWQSNPNNKLQTSYDEMLLQSLFM